MKKAMKLWLIAAASLVLLGGIIFCGVMTALKWDFPRLSTVTYETNRYEVSEAFQNLSIVSDTADIVFLPSENDKCSVVCFEAQNEKHAVSVKNGTLVIEPVDTRKWHEYISIVAKKPKITVYLPQREYTSLFIKEDTGDIDIPRDFRFSRMDISTSTGDVKNGASASEFIKIKTSTGDVSLSSVTCTGDVSIRVSTGKATLTDVSCRRFVSNGSTGDLTVKNVIASESFSIERSTGDIKFEGCDAAEIFVKTDTGDVVGSLLSEKMFVVKTDTGKIEVPNSNIGGRCEITTDTGDIRINVKQ